MSRHTPQAIRGFLVEKGTLGFEPTIIEGKLSLRVGLTGQIDFFRLCIAA